MTASYDGTVQVWRDGGNSPLTVCSLKNPVLDASFSPSGDRILVTGSLPYFYVYSIANNTVKTEYDTLSINKMEKLVGGRNQLHNNSMN